MNLNELFEICRIEEHSCGFVRVLLRIGTMR